MSNRYQETYTSLMIDQHFPAAPFVTFEHFDAREQIRRCVDAHIDSLHITTKCHHGYYYYNTKVGTKHPALGERDQVAELVAAAHEAGLEAVAYSCIQFDNDSVLRHPEWSMLHRDGQPAVFWPTNFRWRIPCINTPYRDEFLAHIREVVTNYDFDALFLDIFALNLWWRWICYCPTCLATYEREGIGLDETDPVEKVKMVRYWDRTWANLLRDVVKISKEAKPDMAVAVNGGPSAFSGDIYALVDWVYQEGGENAAGPAEIRNLGREFPQCGISVGNDAFDAAPLSVARIQTASVLAQGCRTFFFFMQGRDGDGRFAANKYEFLRQINAETLAKIPFVKDARPVTAVGLYHNSIYITARKAPCCTEPDDATLAQPAMIDAFRRLSVPSNMVPDWRLSPEELARYQLLVVPEIVCLSDAEADIISGYVRGGGNVLISGKSGLYDQDNRPRADFALADVMGLRYVGENGEYGSAREPISGFIRPLDRSHPIFKFLPDRDLRMPGRFILQAEPTTAEVLARIAEPTAKETPAQFIGWQCLPPGTKADWPAVTVNDYGKGRCVYISARLSAYAATPGMHWPARFIEGVVNFLGVDAGVSVSGPKGVLEGTYFMQGNRLIVHLLNQSVRKTEGEIIPLRDVRVRLDTAKFPMRAVNMVYPEVRPLTVAQAQGRAEIRVAEVALHSILVVELGS